MQELFICGRAGRVEILHFWFSWTSNNCSFSVNNNRSTVIFAVPWLWHPKEFHNIHIATCQKSLLQNREYYWCYSYYCTSQWTAIPIWFPLSLRCFDSPVFRSHVKSWHVQCQFDTWTKGDCHPPEDEISYCLTKCCTETATYQEEERCHYILQQFTSLK